MLPINGSDILTVEGFMLRNPNRGFKVKKNMKWAILGVQRVFGDLGI